MKNIKIDVTKEHIKNSIAKCPEKCMVANALKDSGFIEVEVKEYSFISYGELSNCSHKFNKLVTAKIMLFDEGFQVTPFSFIVEDVEEKYLLRK